jgi:hypothetical protein
MNEIDFRAKPSLEVVELTAQRCFYNQLKTQQQLIPGLSHRKIIKRLAADMAGRFMKLSEDDKAITLNYIAGNAAFSLREFCECHLCAYPDDVDLIQQVHLRVLQRYRP